jgi:hypothetical protein
VEGENGGVAIYWVQSFHLGRRECSGDGWRLQLHKNINGAEQYTGEWVADMVNFTPTRISRTSQAPMPHTYNPSNSGAEIRRIAVRSHPGQIVHQTLT